MSWIENDRLVERAVLCDLMLGADPGGVEPDDFSVRSRRDIFRAIVAHGPGADFPSLWHKLDGVAQEELPFCIEYAATSNNAKQHVAALKRARQMRDLKQGAKVLLGMLDRNETPEAVAPVLDRLRERAVEQRSRGPRHISETLGQYWLTGPELHVPFGLSALRDLLVVGGELSVPAARPGQGKTAFLGHVALTAAKAGWQVLFFSLEMPAKQIHARFISALSGLSLGTVLAKPDGHVAAIKAAYEELWEMRVWVEDESDRKLDLEAIQALTAMFCEMNQDRPTVVLIDYLQRVQTKARYEKRYELLGHVCRGLKDIAKRNSVPVIAAAQLGRGVEQRGKRSRPQMSDLRESGNIEADADQVILLHRESETLTRFNVVKYRQGATFIAEVGFDGPRCRFVDYSPPEDWE